MGRRRHDAAHASCQRGLRVEAAGSSMRPTLAPDRLIATAQLDARNGGVSRPIDSALSSDGLLASDAVYSRVASRHNSVMSKVHCGVVNARCERCLAESVSARLAGGPGLAQTSRVVVDRRLPHLLASRGPTRFCRRRVGTCRHGKARMSRLRGRSPSIFDFCRSPTATHTRPDREPSSSLAR